MSEISAFWTWFEKNQVAYSFLNEIEEEKKDKLMDDLLIHLHNYCDQLYFEIGNFPGEKQELIITAEGNADYFTKVTELIDCAPPMENWKFIAFKPSIDGDFISDWGDLKIDSKYLWFMPLLRANSFDLGVRIYLPNHDLAGNNESLMPLLYKMMDTILGEKSFALDIHYVETEQLPDDPDEAGLISLLKLPKYISWHKSKYNL